MEGKRSEEQRGQSIILVAVILGLLLVFAALAVDLSNAYAHRRQAQNAADASALGGAGVLGQWLNGSSVTDTDVALEMVRYAQDNAILDTDGNPANGVNSNVFGCYLGADAQCLDGATPLESTAQVGELGSIPEDALGIEVVAFLDAPTYFGGIVGLNGIRVRAEAAALFESACTTEGCILPIAVHSRVFDPGYENYFEDGQCFNIWDGETAGSFGWLNFSFQVDPETGADLACSSRFEFDDCSANCIEALIQPETCLKGIDVGDDIWFGSIPGVNNASGIVESLKEYYVGKDVVARLPVYDVVTDQGGCVYDDPSNPDDQGNYHLAGFASFYLTGYALSSGGGSKYCDALTDGTIQCGELKNKDSLPSGLDYVCDPTDPETEDYPPCYSDGQIVSCASFYGDDRSVNRITGKATTHDEGDTGNCHAIGNLMAPRLIK